MAWCRNIGEVHHRGAKGVSGLYYMNQTWVGCLRTYFEKWEAMEILTYFKILTILRKAIHYQGNIYTVFRYICRGGLETEKQ